MVHVYIIIVQPLLYSGCLNGLPQLEHHWGFEMEKTQAYTQVGDCVWQKGRKATWKPICIGFIPFRESLNGMDDLGFQKSNTNKLQASNSTLFTSLWLHLAIDVVLSQIILALQCVHSDTFPSSYIPGCPVSWNCSMRCRLLHPLHSYSYNNFILPGSVSSFICEIIYYKLLK